MEKKDLEQKSIESKSQEVQYHEFLSLPEGERKRIAIEEVVKKIMSCKDIIPENKQFLSDYVRFSSMNKIKSTTIKNTYWFCIRYLGCNISKPFNEMTAYDTQKFISEINYAIGGHGVHEKGFSPYTGDNLKIKFLQVMRFVHGIHEKGEKPECLKWFNFKRCERKPFNHEDLLSRSDIDKLICSTNNPRDKAFVALLFETGARISEFRYLRLRDLVFHDRGLTVKLSHKENFKNGRRSILVVRHIDLISYYVDGMRDDVDGDSSLWIDRFGKMYTKSSQQKMLHRLFKKAGISKPSHAHMFRHGRATELSPKLTESLMRKFFGWTPTSPMPSYYAHLCDETVDNAIRELNGLSPSVDVKLPKPCGRCKTLNEPKKIYCRQCGIILDEIRAIKFGFVEERSTEALNSRMLTEAFKTAIKTLKTEELSELISGLDNSEVRL